MDYGHLGLVLFLSGLIASVVGVISWYGLVASIILILSSLALAAVDALVKHPINSQSEDSSASK